MTQGRRARRTRRLLAVGVVLAAGLGGLAHDVSPAGAVDPQLSIGDASIIEGDSGTRVVRLMVNLDGVAPAAVTVNFTTVGGTATSGTDFKARVGRVRFNPGQTTKWVKVIVRPDAAVELNEQFFVGLGGASGATIADGAGQATIVDDELATGAQASIGDARVVEGDNGASRFVYLAVALNQPALTTASVSLTTVAGSATAPADYTSRTATITFGPKTRVKYALVYLAADATAEPTQSFTVTLSSPVNLTIGDGSGTVTITDDD
jgi:hypothetical protein